MREIDHALQRAGGEDAAGFGAADEARGAAAFAGAGGEEDGLGADL